MLNPADSDDLSDVDTGELMLLHTGAGRTDVLINELGRFHNVIRDT
jgi:hypothetical protein